MFIRIDNDIINTDCITRIEYSQGDTVKKASLSVCVISGDKYDISGPYAPKVMRVLSDLCEHQFGKWPSDVPGD